MYVIYNLIQENPEFFTWVFGLVNILCGLFVYFHKLRLDRELKHLEQNLRFSADRRLKIFDLKASQYSQYVTDLDSFGQKNLIVIPERMQPIFDKYLQDYMLASDSGNEEKEREVIVWFSSQISSLTQEGYKDLMKLKYESNRLKLIASDEMLETFEKIESLTQELTDITNDFMRNFTEIIINQQTDRSAVFQEKAAVLASEIQLWSKKLLNQMRQEIIGI